MLIGLCGGSGSGKTTLIDLLKEQFPGQVSVIDMDTITFPETICLLKKGGF